MVVARVKKEVIEPGVGLHPANVGFAILHADLPGFRDVLQGGNEAVPRWSRVHGADPGACACAVLHRDDVHEFEIVGVEQNQSMGR